MNVYWYAIPVVAAFSLVYAASRHESWPKIFRHALRLALSITGIMVATMAALLLINAQL